MNEDPLIILIYCAIGLYIANLYRADIRSFVADRPNVKALPGAKPTTGLLIFASVLAAFVLLGNAVIGEYALGIVEAQSEMVWFFVFAFELLCTVLFCFNVFVCVFCLLT